MKLKRTWKLEVELIDDAFVDEKGPCIYSKKELTQELKRVLGPGELLLKLRNFKLEEK